MDLTEEPLAVDLDAWEAWTPSEAALRLEALTEPWYVAAGWALDLFLGEQRREHDDLEVGIPSQSFPLLREVLAGFELVVVGGGQAWPVTERSLAAHHQTWVRDRHSGRWRIDVFREPWVGDTWICRRDSRILLDASRLISRTPDGIPFAQPEVVLLFKAKAKRPKDELDFATVLPHLGARRRAWLRDALALVHPGHDWIGRLSPPVS